jgi:hypothetical protein
MNPTTPPEFESIESFVEYKMEDDQATFTHVELTTLGFHLRRSFHALRVELEGYGLSLERRLHVKSVRGVSSNGNDRYYGPGAEKMHGGSGWEQINGFAGQKG